MANLKTTPQACPKRTEIAEGENLCIYCDAQCCRYFALPIEKPESWQEFDFVRWFMLHENVTVFVDDGTWYILVHNKCKNLMDDNRCGAYETRPQICRDYTTARCEYDNCFVYDQYFELPDQVEEYAQAVLGPRPGKDFRTDRN
ncbi:MAG: YkgJ family cysteine cluster protein [Planctomycetia bacterium]|nr:YkgJ family cysteine cluster protein [Planctomycetia bacterium]